MEDTSLHSYISKTYRDPYPPTNSREAFRPYTDLKLDDEETIDVNKNLVREINDAVCTELSIFFILNGLFSSFHLFVQDHITPDKHDELKREVLAEIDCLLEKWKLDIVKCPHINEQDLNERSKYLKKVVNVEPHGEAVFIGVLLCGTPQAKGHVHASCGGSCREGHSYDCDTTIALDNIISTLVEKDAIQLVDVEDKCPIMVVNARKCNLTEADLAEFKKKGKRWTCNSWTESEAIIAADEINLVSGFCKKLRVPTILLEAGGVTKNTNLLNEFTRWNTDGHHC